MIDIRGGVVIPVGAGIVVEALLFVAPPGRARDGAHEKVADRDASFDEDFPAEGVGDRRRTIEIVRAAIAHGAEGSRFGPLHAAVAAGHLDADDDAIVHGMAIADLAAADDAVDPEVGIEISAAGTDVGTDVEPFPGLGRRCVVVSECGVRSERDCKNCDDHAHGMLLLHCCQNTVMAPPKGAIILYIYNILYKYVNTLWT